MTLNGSHIIVDDYSEKGQLVVHSGLMNICNSVFIQQFCAVRDIPLLGMPIHKCCGGIQLSLEALPETLHSLRQPYQTVQKKDS